MESIMFMLVLLAVPCLVWSISALLNRKSRMTARATVVSHRLELGIGGGRYGGDNWNRLVTFRLTDSSEIELFTTKQIYNDLTEGQTGQLTWEQENLIHFDPDTAS